MDSRATSDMDDAWRAYLVEHDADPVARHGWNPRRIFEAGWLASARSSGWSGAEVDDV